MLYDSHLRYVVGRLLSNIRGTAAVEARILRMRQRSRHTAVLKF